MDFVEVLARMRENDCRKVLSLSLIITIICLSNARVQLRCQPGGTA